MENFKKETLNALKANGKTIEDIEWIGNDSGKKITDIKEFFDSINFRYDDGFGGAEINGSLVIVGDNWWLERGEYDGSEWWSFKSIPELSKEVVKIKPSELY